MPKLLHEYTGADLEDFTEAQLRQLTQLECAEAGAPVMLEPPKPITTLQHDYDVTIYQVAGLSATTREDAEKIADFLSKIPLYREDYAGYQYYEKIVKPAEQVTRDSITTRRCYSEQQFHKYKDIVNENTKKKNEYDAEKKEYDKASDIIGKISESVSTSIYEAQRFKNKREQLLAELDRYIELAEKDEAMGLRFFEKARPEYISYFTASIRSGRLVIWHKRYINTDNPNDRHEEPAYSEEEAA